mgnify:CR=1 FL=1
MMPCGPPDAWSLSLAAGSGALVGWIVSRVVAGLVEPRPDGVGRGGRLGTAAFVAAFAVAAAALWWWEVVARGQLPVAIAGTELSPTMLAWRWGGHLMLLAFLAAATWVDLRDRVIPDAITLPGVLAGLAWAGLRPGTLLPVARVVPRTFAAPLFEWDVLGPLGPLGAAPLPAWLGAAPALAGFAAAASVFVAWWIVCTAPAEADASGRRRFDPRLPVLTAGLAGIGGVWWCGGDHWAALLSSLVGLAAGVAVVWSTRIGASRALGREALGFGDVTLMAVIGAWLGWQAVVLTCGLGVLVGLAHGLALFALARDNELPFGPSLCAGAMLVVVGWRPLWVWFGPAFERPGEIAAVVAAVIVLTALTLAAWWRLRGETHT